MRTAWALLLVLSGVAALAQSPPAAEPLVIVADQLGDSPGGVATRITFTVDPSVVTDDRELILQGSILIEGSVFRNFRRPLIGSERNRLEMLQVLPVGAAVIEARLLVMKDGSPLLLAKKELSATIRETGIDFVADEEGTAEEILAEGVVPGSAGAIAIQPPRRDLAPNLFIVDVDVKEPVRRVEFWIDGKKIMTRNAPPYRAELDLGAIPRRVEVRAVGYDARGRYIDADAWIVNERENDLEVKVTKTDTPDGVSHFKVSVQNPKRLGTRRVTLHADDEQLARWAHPPYALDIDTALLAGKTFIRATLIDDSGGETTDLLYLEGDRYVERLDVNLVELPVSVFDSTGTPVAALTKDEFEVYEEGKQKAIEAFGFSSDLRLTLGLLLDHSGSMQPRIEQARRAAVEFFAQVMREGDRAFFGGFSFAATDLTPLVSDVSSLQHEISGLGNAEGATALYDAIVTGLYRFRGIEGRKALVVVTDGEDTSSRVDYDSMLRYVRATRVPVYFVGIGISRMDFTLSSRLRTLAAESGAVAYFASGGEEMKDELREIYTRLEQELRSQYLLGYYTEVTTGDDAYRTVEVRVKRAGAKARTIRGFLP
ncbi:MAG TPA: VWA domain-containing protein [Thermoanaerobaculia bacterium]|nr:VWA domain-containing protein [Thermoanaerobaculia bacterium]